MNQLVKTKVTPDMNRILLNKFSLGAVLMLVFYGVIFTFFSLTIEDKNSENRLTLIAPFQLDVFRQGPLNIVKVDPVLTLYPSFNHLPQFIRSRMDTGFVGTVNININETQDFNIVAQTLHTAEGERTVYAVENTEAFELEDEEYVVYQSVLFALGLTFLLFVAYFIVQTSTQLSQPFSKLTARLLASDVEDYSPITAEGQASFELEQLVTAINTYRTNILLAVEREKSFTRYVSHELRTPQTVIRGSLSVLKKKLGNTHSKQLQLIEQSVNEMEQLTHTFLLLARKESGKEESVVVDTALCDSWLTALDDLVAANNVELNLQLTEPLQVHCHPVLLTALVSNLVKNAINCSLNGVVTLKVEGTKMSVIDNGVGLQQKARGYEGFGIGLNIVQDICDKYHWTFSLTENKDQGCTAVVLFS